MPNPCAAARAAAAVAVKVHAFFPCCHLGYLLFYHTFLLDAAHQIVKPFYHSGADIAADENVHNVIAIWSCPSLSQTLM